MMSNAQIAGAIEAIVLRAKRIDIATAAELGRLVARIRGERRLQPTAGEGEK